LAPAAADAAAGGATGLMSARWLGLLTVWLVLERLSPRGGLLATLGGLALIAYGAVRLA
jgi:predicted metal-binding membrane protein